MNHNVVHWTPLDVADARATGLDRIPFADGLFQTKATAATLESADIVPPAKFDNVVGSWAAEMPPGAEIELSVKVRHADEWSDWISLGAHRSDGFSSPPPAAVSVGEVRVDELRLKNPADAARYRLRLRAGGRPLRLHSIALAFSAPGTPPAVAPFAAGPWVRELAVPPLSQFEAQDPRRGDLCSPTSLAMVLQFWGFPGAVEKIAKAVQDRTSGLFGNWPANTTYAGARGLDARVARLESIHDLELEIADGRPVIVSVAFDAGGLPGSPLTKTDGHLMVVTGFAADGAVIVCDPAAPNREQVRRVYPREAFHKAWRGRKRGVAYLIGIDFPRRLSVGVAVADLWERPLRRTKFHLDDETHLSQLLYGETVTALESRGDWVRVRADEQENLHSEGTWQGYPGWVRAGDLSSATSIRPTAVVRYRQTLVQRGDDLLALSVGTRIPVIAESAGSSQIRLLDGSIGRVPTDSLYAAPAKPTAASRAEIIRTAELFLGTSYYWGGRSGVQPDPGVGVDCSGLVSLAYRIHGRDVPRNSHEQKLRARAIRRNELLSGDLVFLTDRDSSEVVTHVMIFTGGDGLIESRKSSGRVLRATFLERFGAPLTALESGDVVEDLSFPRARRRRIFFGSYF